MNAQDCLNMLQQIRDVAFATVSEDGWPKNRIIDVMLTEHEKLYFCTATGKDFYQELIKDGRVAIAGLNQQWQMVRLTGVATKLEEQKYWIDRIFAENPSMNDIYPGESRYALEPFCIERGEAEFFDLGKLPIERASFAIGGASVQGKGFMITESCTGCGICARVCPQQCITVGKPSSIAQQHCLHCGRCAQHCPNGSIVRRENHAT